MHLHGHNMFVLSEGVGTWDGSSVVNGANPQRRDVQLLQPNGYLVVQIDADNPGVWPFHCHIAWHVSAGLYVNIMVGLFISLPGHSPISLHLFTIFPFSLPFTSSRP